MTTVSMIFPTLSGSYSIASPLLTNVVILRVCRQGVGYNTITGTDPGNREARYIDSAGQLVFENPFEPDPDPSSSLEAGEPIYVRFKY
jgi:hypothetical protein